MRTKRILSLLLTASMATLLATLPSYEVSAAVVGTGVTTSAEKLGEDSQLMNIEKTVDSNQKQVKIEENNKTEVLEDGTSLNNVGNNLVSRAVSNEQATYDVVSIKLDKTMVNLGENIKLIVEISAPDDVDITRIRLAYDTPFQYTELTLDKVGKNKFETVYTVKNQYNLAGDWILSNISMYKANDEYVTLGYINNYPNLGQGNFKVVNTDKIVPVMEEFEVSDTVILLNEEFRITAKVKDNQQVKNVVVVIQSPTTKENFGIPLSLSSWSNEHFTTLMHFNEESDLGTWKIVGVYVEDGNGNHQEYFNNDNQVSPVLKDAKIELINGDVKEGWNNVKGNWYFYENYNNAILRQRRGWLLDGGKWYYMNNFGRMQIGWVNANNRWYFMDGSGAMKTGWLQIGGKWYLFEESGAMKTGWLKSGNKWYYLGTDGAMKTSWVQVNDVWYFMDSSGTMKTGWTQLGGKWYFFEDSGAMQIGWVLSGGQWYFMEKNGVMKTGWLQWNGKWYYLYSSGQMAKNTTIGGCKLDGSGVWVQ